MFTGFNITNILGSRIIDNATPFIIIYCDDMSKFLDKIKFVNPYTIYRTNIPRLTDYIKQRKIEFDISIFSPVGDICSDRKITKILLANKNIVPCSSVYKYIGKLGTSVLWIAEMKRKTIQSRSIGTILTNTMTPPSFETPVVPRSYLINMDFGQSLLKGNDLNILNVRSDGLWILIRDKFNTIPKWDTHDFKYISRKGNYLSVADDDSENIKLLPENSRNQKITTTDDNQLMINNKCLEVTSSGKVVLKKCNSSNSQKWISNGNNFVSIANNVENKCIGYDENGDIILQQCENVSWTKKNDDNNNWTNIKGKTLVLKNRNNPWFTNEKIVKNVEYFQPPIPKPICSYDDFTPAVKCSPKEKISYDDINIDCKEQFQQKKKNKKKKKNTSSNFIILLLVIILLIVIIIKGGRKHFKKVQFF
jgi:hypothetical protein